MSAPIPFAEVRAWLFEAALPYWAARGIDHPHGGFYEELDLSGAPTGVAFKRVRAMCRQVYVFSHAALLGWSEGAALSDYGYDYVKRTSWLGPGRGWAKMLSREGAVTDATPDLYDQAFGLYAMAWRHRLSGDGEPLVLAHQTLDFIEAQMRDTQVGGFWSALPAGEKRAQNPHMHLLEASLALYEASGEQRFIDIANEIVGLFQRYFFDGRTLGEHYTRELERLPGEEGRIIEPGHHFEWAWILAQHQRLTGADCAPAMRALVAFAEAHGVNVQTGATCNSVRDDGAPLDTGSRTWPNTERLKAWLGLAEVAGADGRAQIAQTTRLLLDRYLDVTPRGSWQDHFDAEGRPLVKAAPASTFYHVLVAFADLLRLEDKLT